MIFFADESYEQLDSGGYRVVISGILIDEYRYRALETAVYVGRLDLVRRILARDLLTEDELRSRAYRFELKGENCFKRKALVRASSGNDEPGIRTGLSVLEAAGDCRARVIAEVRTVERLSEFFGDGDRCTEPCVSELKTIGRCTPNRDRPVTLAFDTVHGKINQGLSRRISNYLYRHPDAEELRHIVPVPFWIPSDSTAGSQLADIVCWLKLRDKPKDALRPILEPHYATIKRMSAK